MLDDSKSGENANVIKKIVLFQTNTNLMVGDTEIDYLAARSAGVDFAFKPDGFRTLNSLRSILQIEPDNIKLFN